MRNRGKHVHAAMIRPLARRRSGPPHLNKPHIPRDRPGLAPGLLSTLTAPGMTTYIVRRLLMMVPVALFASVILFALLKMTPGDPVRIQLGEQVTEENAASLSRELGLDQPYPDQYAKWLGRLARLDFGKSLRNGAPVEQEIISRIPATFQLGITALALSIFVAVPLGVFAAIFRRSKLSFLATAFTTVGVSLPSFFFGAILIYVFAAQLR